MVGPLIALWEETSEALHHRPLPELRNTDGDELLLTVDRFSLVSGARAEVAARLTALHGVETSEEDGALLVTFTRPGNEMHESWDNTIVGNAKLGADEMKVETNSRQRADALRQRLEEACAGLLMHRIREHTDLESVLAKSRGEPRQPAMPKSQKELDLLRDFKEKHYAAWIDQPLPALRGATPLQAVRTARGRKQVELLLKELENGESRLPQGERFDVSVLRSRLGLERAVDYLASAGTCSARSAGLDLTVASTGTRRGRQNRASAQSVCARPQALLRSEREDIDFQSPGDCHPDGSLGGAHENPER